MPHYLIEYATSDGGLRSQGETYRNAQAARKSYRERLGTRILLAGPTFDETHEDAVGSIMIIEAASREEAREIASEDPYFQIGEFATFSIHELRIATSNPLQDPRT